MKLNPKKRVGSPASVRGVRGTYLLYMIGYLAISLFAVLIITAFSIPFTFKGILLCFVVVFVVYKYYDYVKLSKGDMQKPVKDSCRISIVIKK